jgi:hypothetical protein
MMPADLELLHKELLEFDRNGGLGRFFSAHLSFFCRKCFSQSLRPISATWSRSKSRSVPFAMVPEESRLQLVGVCVMPLRSIVN